MSGSGISTQSTGKGKEKKKLNSPTRLVQDLGPSTFMCNQVMHNFRNLPPHNFRDLPPAFLTGWYSQQVSWPEVTTGLGKHSVQNF